MALDFCVVREVVTLVSFTPVSFDIFDFGIGLLVTRGAEEGAASGTEIAVVAKEGRARRAGSIVAEEVTAETARGRAIIREPRGVSAEL